ncbi:hypothetical protein MRBLRC7O_000926 [Agrobacterium radiobacter]|uniref:hypothetical protein n=1 Tax=Agrobacterium radiobacter TaxID=362 RepID=UPI0034676C84
MYSKPAGTTAVPNTTIESAKYNQTIDDLVADANAARPITAGGTGGVTPVAAADNLSKKGDDIASSATTDIGGSTGTYVNITGTTTITSLGSKAAGVMRICTFSGSLALTHNATSLILPGGANIQTAANDVAIFISEGSGNWRCVSYTRASELPYPTVSSHLSGMTTSNNGSWGIDIAAGVYKVGNQSTANVATFSKNLNTVWAAGSGNGGRDTATAVVANGTYHLFALRNNSSGAFDAVFSPSTTPTVPSGYTLIGRIGSYVVNSGNTAIVPFTQVLSDFYVINVDAMAFTVSQVEALNTTTAGCPCPSGVSMEMKATARIVNSAGNTDVRFADASGFSIGGAWDMQGTTNAAITVYMAGKLKTDTSRRVRVFVSISGTATVTLTFGGWRDFTLPRLGS